MFSIFTCAADVPNKADIVIRGSVCVSVLYVSVTLAVTFIILLYL